MKLCRFSLQGLFLFTTTVAIFLALPETWGLIEPTVISEKRRDTIVPLTDQIDRLLMRLRKLTALQNLPNKDKKIAALMAAWAVSFVLAVAVIGYCQNEKKNQQEKHQFMKQIQFHQLMELDK